MSLPKQTIDPMPEDNAQVARKAVPKGNPYIQMRDMLGTIYIPRTDSPQSDRGDWRWSPSCNLLKT